MKLLERLEVPENRALRWRGDIGLTVVLILVFAVLATSGTNDILTSALMIAPLALRRHYPLLMLALMTISGIVMVITTTSPQGGLVAVPIAVYSVARWVPGLPARASVLVGGFASIIGPARWVLSASNEAPQIVAGFGIMASLCLGVVLTPYVIGRRVRETALARKAEADAVADRYQRMILAREQSARMAEGRARTEIARELHDIVAHSLSVMVVQAEGGKALATKKPEQAAEVLGTIAETGREALSEMRRIVGVLRADGQTATAEYAPTPGLPELPDMLEKAGHRVQYIRPPQLPQVPTTLGLTAYRIVQESVTNFLKHAGAEATATVEVQATPRYLRVQISDDGLGGLVSGDGAGSGLKGMRERVAAMGGQLVAGPKPGGGYEVCALLPIPASRGQATVAATGVR